MPVGSLDRQITLQFKTSSVSAGGEPLDTWGGDVKVWALVEPVSGREYFAALAAQLVAEEFLSFTIRFRSDVRPGTAQVVYQGRTYNIRRVAEEGRRQYLQIFGETTTA